MVWGSRMYCCEHHPDRCRHDRHGCRCSPRYTSVHARYLNGLLRGCLRKKLLFESGAKLCR